MFYLRPHTSDIRVFCLHFRGFILRHYQLRYKTFVTLGISTSYFFIIAKSLNFLYKYIYFSQGCTGPLDPLKFVIHMRTRY